MQHSSLYTYINYIGSIYRWKTFSETGRDWNEIVSRFNDLILFVVLTFKLFTSEAVTVSTNQTYF